MLKIRYPLYEKAADLCFDATGKGIPQVVEEIHKELLKLQVDKN